VGEAQSGDSLPCTHCGAPVEIGSEAQSTCAFCLGTVDVPVELRQPLVDDQALRARLQRAESDLQIAKESAASGRRALIRNIALAVVVVCGVVVVQGVYWLLPAVIPAGDRQPDPLDLVQSLMTTATYVLAIAVMVLNLGFGKVVEYRRARRAPFAIPEGARARCPSCGAHVTAGRGVTARCGSCRTEMLLPAYLVAVRLRKRHHDAVMAHEEVGEHQQGQRLASMATLGCGGMLYLGFAAGMLAIPPALVVISVSGLVPMGVFGVLGATGPPALLLAAAFGFSGLRMMWSALQVSRAG
jgi:hypothetical protein